MAKEALIAAFVLDGRGGARHLDWEGVRAWRPEQGFLWLHLNHAHEETQAWIRAESGLDKQIAKALTAAGSRPRIVRHEAGLLSIFRAANLNPGADPEDMIALRCWIDPTRAITVRHRQSMAASDLRKALHAGHGPTRAGDFLTRLADALSLRLVPLFEELDAGIEKLEDTILDGAGQLPRNELGERRRQVILLRRYLIPQRDALARLHAEQIAWLQPDDVAAMREVADRMTRFVEDLDAARDRLMVARDELETRANVQMNATMLRLAMITALFLPLGLLTGLLGINVGGIPGSDDPWAFAMVCLLLLAVAGLQLLLFRRLRWI